MGTTPERVKQKNARWRERHREQIRESNRQYYAEHAEERRAYRAARDAADPEAKRARDRRHGAKRRLLLRQALLAKLGGVCVRCGFDDWRALQVDHINGGGTKARNAMVSKEDYYRQILDHDGSDYQLLCANCNQIKRYEQGEVRQPAPISLP